MHHPRRSLGLLLVALALLASWPSAGWAQPGPASSMPAGPRPEATIPPWAGRLFLPLTVDTRPPLPTIPLLYEPINADLDNAYPLSWQAGQYTASSAQTFFPPGTTQIVSIASDGTQRDHDSSHASISANGRYVLFHSYATTLVPGDTNHFPNMFLRDLLTSETTRVSVASDGT